ncbi:MAG: dockerin type I repeat-containing protein, partial [candidate division Zixibacteria bacterium]|nr:dockerin type I repeat-containing protein [candidate division Zixibacteria bacterium]
LVSWELDTNFYEPMSQLADGIYYWRVKVFDNVSMDSSEYSPGWSFVIDETPPEQPVLLLPEDQSMTGYSTPLFDWTESTKRGTPVSYTLLVSIDPAFAAGPATHEYSGLDVSELVVPDPLTDGVPTYWKVIAEDAAVNSSTSATFTVSYFEFICGDINGDGQEVIDIADLVWLVDYMFNSGPEPPQLLAADMDASGGLIDIADIVYLVDHMFNEGPPPVCL